MKGNPLISIIVPVYNAERYLLECLNSLDGQTYDLIEIIVINDGSTDNSEDVIYEFKESSSRKIIYYKQENQGVSVARNQGLSMAKGQYFMFADADDILDKNAVEILYNNICCFSADMSVGLVREEREKIVEDHQVKEYFDDQALISYAEDDPIFYSACGKLYSRKYFNNVLFPEGYKVHEDGFFVFECVMKKPKVVTENTVVYTYRYNQESASRAEFSEKFLDVIRLAEIKRDRIEKECPELRKMGKNIWIKANLTLLHCLCNTEEKQYKTLEKKCISEVVSNKEYYIPITNSDNRWFFIITHRLFGLYKLMFRITH